MFQYVVISLLKSRRSFKPEFLQRIKEMYQLAEETQNLIIGQLGSEDYHKVDIDCHKGCSHCCGMIVTPTMPELYIIFEHIKKTYTVSEIEDLIKNLRSHKERCAKANTVKERVKIYCTFLKDGICSIQDVKPLSCRAYTSTNVHKCMEFITNPMIDIPTSIYHYYPFHLTRKAIMKSLFIAGFKDVTEELNSGILRLLEGEFEKEI